MHCTDQLSRDSRARYRGAVMGLRARRLAALAGFGSAGVLLGHWITYLIAVAEGPERGHLLAHTGHSYLQSMSELAIVAAVAAFLALLMPPFRARMTPRPATLDVGARLALIQIGGFTAMEVGERVHARVPITELGAHGIYYVGVAVQLAIALLVGWILALLLHRTAAASPASATPSLRRGSALHLLCPSLDLRLSSRGHLCGCQGLRSPPFAR